MLTVWYRCFFPHCLSEPIRRPHRSLIGSSPWPTAYHYRPNWSHPISSWSGQENICLQHKVESRQKQRRHDIPANEAQSNTGRILVSLHVFMDFICNHKQLWRSCNVFILPVLLSQVDEDVALDQALKFCQIQLATSAQRQVSRFYSTAELHFHSQS